MLFALPEIMKTEIFWALILGLAIIALILAMIAWNVWFNPQPIQKKEPTRPKAIIIFCSDPRFQAEFARFIRKKLKLYDGEFVPILIGGGPAVLANITRRCYDFKFLKGQIEFFSSHFPSIKEIVLVGHQDCGYYNKILELPGLEFDDPFMAKQILSTFCSKLIWLYYAEFMSDDQTQITFDPVLTPTKA